jgi:nucleoside-diphosphate-sugar epimerase
MKGASILVTGSRGLIGRHLIPLLRQAGHSVRYFDIADRDKALDLRHDEALADVLASVDGVIHLAAVSRVVWGQKDPENCVLTNTDATQKLLSLCLGRKHKPWVIYSSSREVYGQAQRLPVKEDDPLEPMNVYAMSKVDAERACRAAQESGLVANVVRFSSVYGCPEDHPDRVVPAFARAAATGGTIRLEGRDNVLDFTFIDDVVRGVMKVVQLTNEGEKLPPVHFVSGVGTTLGALASMAQAISRFRVEVVETSPRTYDVSRFIGDPSRAASVLGWAATTTIESGFEKLVQRLSTVRTA